MHLAKKKEMYKRCFLKHILFLQLIIIELVSFRVVLIKK